MTQNLKNKLIVFMLIVFFAVLIPVISFAEDKKEDKLLAVVGNKKIMQSDVLAKIEMMPPQFKSRYQSEEARKTLLDQTIKFSLLSQEARRLGIDQQAEVKNRVEEIVNNIIIQELTKQEVSGKITVSDEDMEEYYNANVNKFTLPEKVKVSLIFIEVKDDTAAVKKEKKVKAEKILARLKKGEKIAALAKQLSDDVRTKKRKGTTGFFAKGRRLNSYGQAFENKAFSLKPGELSDVVESKGGFYILQLAKKKAGKKQMLDEVKPRIERSLKQAKQKETYDTYLESLKKKYPIKIMD